MILNRKVGGGDFEIPYLHEGNVDGQNHPIAGPHPGYASCSGRTQGRV